MVKIENVERAYIGKETICPIKIDAGGKVDVLDFKLKPYNGDYLVEILPIREKFMSALEAAGGDNDKAALLCDESVFVSFRDLLANWLATDIQSESFEKSVESAKGFLKNNDVFIQVSNYFEQIHGFGKKTNKDELIEDVTAIRKRMAEEKRNDRKPKKDRNLPGGATR